jgi:putative endonuclease
MRSGWVYIMANRYRGTTYIGVTSDLGRRAWQHKHGRWSAFAKKYGAVRLVHVEPFERIDEAIAREKALKKWYRAWKIELIERHHPDWDDLYRFLPE